MGKSKRPKPTHPMMDKPEWLQRFEDPDNMTIKEREKWENEAELRAKMYADAQIFEKFINEQRRKWNMKMNTLENQGFLAGLSRNVCISSTKIS